MNRRTFLEISSGVIAGSMLGLPLLSCSSSTPTPPPVDWSQAIQTYTFTGKAILKEIEGVAFINTKKAYPGDNLNSYDELFVRKKSIVYVTLQDSSIFKVKGPSHIIFQLDKTSGGIIQLKAGSLLSVVPRRKKRPYILKMASVAIGIRGTVCFSHVINKQSPPIKKAPDNATDYFCICNGNIDYLDQTHTTITSAEAEHHNAFFIEPGPEHIKLSSAGYLYDHDDTEIYNLIEKMEGEKHPQDWLVPDTPKHYGA